VTHTVVLATGVAALVAVVVRPVWALTGHLATAMHEGGHALVALAVGRRVTGIRLHANRSGLTRHIGDDRGPGRVAIVAAGYPAPSLIGLGCAALLATGHGPLAPLLLGLIAMAGMLLLVRNVFGALWVITAGGLLVAAVYRAAPQVQLAAAYTLTWFLLFAGVRGVAELHRVRRVDRSGRTDADQLKRLTGVPAPVWVLGFAALSLGAAVLAARWLLG
jgi:Peptidase M50B-like